MRITTRAAARAILIGISTVVGGAAAQAATVTISPEAGFTITRTGSEGQYFNNTATYAATVPANDALASTGTTAFASAQFGGNHQTVFVNNGIYGNNQSWLANTAVPEFVGLNFSGTNPVRTVNIGQVAWGRDNGHISENAPPVAQYTDRTFDTYTLQYTTIASGPGVGTTVTGVAATGWQNIGTVVYSAAGTTPDFVSPSLRHQYDVTLAGLPITATGFRISVASGQTAIDEIEVSSVPEPTSLGLIGLTAIGLLRRRRRA